MLFRSAELEAGMNQRGERDDTKGQKIIHVYFVPSFVIYTISVSVKSIDEG